MGRLALNLVLNIFDLCRLMEIKSITPSTELLINEILYLDWSEHR